VPPELARKALDAVVRALFELSWNEARDRIRSGKVTVNGAVRTDVLFRALEGAEIRMALHAPRARGASLDGAVYVDPHVVVVNKPAGISTVPFEPGEKGTLDESVRRWLARKGSGRERPALGVVHRLDKETSGLLVFTRTWLAKKSLTAQFRAHSVERRYLALALGRVAPGTIRSHLVPDRGDGLRGSRPPRGGDEGQLAVTHVEVLERFARATLVACTLETGRTHQIRIHLSEASHPLVGERVYVRRYTGPTFPAPRLMLHAARLGFVHPKTGEKMAWEQEPPKDFEETRERLRREGHG
jgi:23S rRNA pseudouridine1911/1915/1917 synthase